MGVPVNREGRGGIPGTGGVCGRALTILTMPRWTARGGAEPPCPGGAAEAMAGRGRRTGRSRRERTGPGASAEGSRGAGRRREVKGREGKCVEAGASRRPAPPPGRRPTGGRPRRPPRPLPAARRPMAPRQRPERPPRGVTSREAPPLLVPPLRPAERGERDGGGEAGLPGHAAPGTRRQRASRAPTWPPAAPGAGPGGVTPPLRHRPTPLPPRPCSAEHRRHRRDPSAPHPPPIPPRPRAGRKGSRGGSPTPAPPAPPAALPSSGFGEKRGGEGGTPPPPPPPCSAAAAGVILAGVGVGSGTAGPRCPVGRPRGHPPPLPLGCPTEKPPHPTPRLPGAAGGVTGTGRRGPSLPVASTARGQPSSSSCGGSGDLQSGCGAGVSSGTVRPPVSMGGLWVQTSHLRVTPNPPANPAWSRRTGGASAGLGRGVTPARVRHPSRRLQQVTGQPVVHARARTLPRLGGDSGMPLVLTRPETPSVAVPFPSSPSALSTPFSSSPAACPSPRCRGTAWARTSSSHPAAAAAQLGTRLCQLRNCQPGTESCHLWVVGNNYPLSERSRRESRQLHLSAIPAPGNGSGTALQAGGSSCGCCCCDSGPTSHGAAGPRCTGY